MRASLETDSANRLHRGSGGSSLPHESVNHNAGEYVRGDVEHESWPKDSSLSSSGRIDGTHHHVSEEHLHRYLGEFDFRYSTCKMSDYGRMRTLCKRMDGRLSYKRLAVR